MSVLRISFGAAMYFSLGAGGVFCPTAFAQQIDSFWGGGFTGSWSNPANWTTPDSPNNGSPPGTTYRVFIDATGVAYVVTLDTAVTLDQLILDSADATLLISNQLDLLGSLDRLNGSIVLDGGQVTNGTINLNGDRLFATNSQSNVLDGVTINGILDLRPSLTADPGMGEVGTVVLRSGLVLDGTIQFSQSSDLRIDGNQTISGGELRFDSGSGLGGRVIDDHLTPTSMLTLDEFVTTTVINGTFANFAGLALLNHDGSMLIDGMGSTLTIDAEQFSNTGDITVQNGGTLGFGITDPSGLSNSGTISINNGNLRLFGEVSTSAIQSFSLSGSRVSLEGRIDNAGSTLILDAASGTWEANGGTIVGGTVQIPGNSALVFNGSDGGQPRTFTLDGTTLTGDLTLPDMPVNNPTPTLTIQNGLTLNGSITAAGNGRKIILNGSQTLSGGSYSLQGGVPEVELAFTKGAGPAEVDVTLSPTVFIEGGRASIQNLSGGDAVSTLINQGWIAANRTGETLTIAPDTLENDGILQATSGGTLAISASPFINRGELRVDNGTLRLGGTISFESGSTWNRTGGTVLLTGHIDNVGRTVLLDSTSGDVRVDGALVTGGTIELQDGAKFLFDANNDQFTLDAVTFASNFEMQSNRGRLTIQNGLDLGGHILRLTANDSTIRALGSQELDNGQIDMLTTGERTFDLSALTTLRVGANLVVDGGSPSPGDSSIGSNFEPDLATTLINDGTISSTTNLRWLRLRPNHFVNNGLVLASNGGTVELFDDRYNTWVNEGIFRVSSGGALDLGGEVETPDLGTIENLGGEVRLRGTLNNTDHTLVLNSTTGNLKLFQDGTIKGGVIETQDGTELEAEFTGHLNGVTLNGDAYVTFGTFAIGNGLTLNGTMRLGPGGNASFNDNPVLDSGTIFFDPTGAGQLRTLRAPNNTLTIGPAATVRGGRALMFTNETNSILNQGTITADVSGETITIRTARFFNDGVVMAENGGMIVFDPPIAAASSIDRDLLAMSVTSYGMMTIDALSEIILEASFIQGDQSTMEIQIDGIKAGRLAVRGEASFDGALRIAVANPLDLNVGDRFQILDLDTVTSWFDRIETAVLGTGMYFDTSNLATQGFVQVIPAPGTIGVAICMLSTGVLRRPKRTTASAVV